jgi:glutamine amidotransferase
MKNTITVIDYGINNIQSVIQAFNFIGVKTVVADNSSLLEKATHIVLPGVGAFPEGMKKLKKLGLDKMIKNKAMQKSKILGICLGMQMLFSKSYEYRLCEGLNLIPGDVIQIKNEFDSEDRVPVIGWRETICIPSFKENILNDVLDKKVFYYLHSFQVKPENKKNILAFYNRRNEKINATIASNNIWGVQFHPEKSGDAGLEFLKSFSSLKIE